MSNAGRLHYRRYGLLTIARRHPILFWKLTHATKSTTR